MTTEDRGADELRRRVKELQAELDGLRRALRSRATIEQAMGVLVVAHRCTPQQAFRLLIRLSQQHNVKLHRVADLLVQLAAKAETHQLESLLKQAADEGTEEAGSLTGDFETALVEVARKLAGGSPEAVSELHKLLLDRGWIPPYTVLAAALE
ncbi:ANTAR domain-containing protein [Amycolatopsis sp. 195334CR]|uniref:ANTAR domain-containing protein n=1 Tax=Amycolatopsis sp. 195334CR TaxID=2814588 RepID=UPI001A90A8FA|nr:ANTAR domain-containing protein [Amycolatopsis sp. 195334CR]MBN6037191.1 ANTAR domain-containing protein [Amycolatopsis sp. 195334CR]